MEPLYLLLFICYSSYAYNRKSVILCMPMLKADGLDASHAGLIVSCQNFAYSISKFFAGILSDRLSPFQLFATGLCITGLSTLLFSWSSSVTVFCMLWFLNGFGQGCGFPACAKILRQRASPSQFGTLWSFLTSSNNFSGSLGPLLSAFITIHYGWRWSLFFSGFLTLFLLVVFILCWPLLSCNRSQKIPGTERSEDRKPSSSESRGAQTSVHDLLRDPFIWLLSTYGFVVFCARSTTIDWGQLYLMEEKHHTQYVASAFTSSVEIGGFVGRMMAGYTTDWLIGRRHRDPKQKSPHWKPVLRISVAVVYIFGSLVSLHLFRFAISEESSMAWIMCVGAMMGLCFYGLIAIFGIVSTESFPPHLSGTSYAISGLFQNVGATVSGLPFSYIAKHYSWSAVFLIQEVMIAAVVLLMMRYRTLAPKIEKIKEE